MQVPLPLPALAAPPATPTLPTGSPMRLCLSSDRQQQTTSPWTALTSVRDQGRVGATTSVLAAAPPRQNALPACPARRSPRRLFAPPLQASPTSFPLACKVRRTGCLHGAGAGSSRRTSCLQTPGQRIRLRARPVALSAALPNRPQSWAPAKSAWSCPTVGARVQGRGRPAGSCPGPPLSPAAAWPARHAGDHGSPHPSLAAGLYFAVMKERLPEVLQPALAEPAAPLSNGVAAQQAAVKAPATALRRAPPLPMPQLKLSVQPLLPVPRLSEPHTPLADEEAPIPQASNPCATPNAASRVPKKHTAQRLGLRTAALAGLPVAAAAGGVPAQLCSRTATCRTPTPDLPPASSPCASSASLRPLAWTLLGAPAWARPPPAPQAGSSGGRSPPPGRRVPTARSARCAAWFRSMAARSADCWCSRASAPACTSAPAVHVGLGGRAVRSCRGPGASEVLCARRRHSAGDAGRAVGHHSGAPAGTRRTRRCLPGPVAGAGRLVQSGSQGGGAGSVAAGRLARSRSFARLLF